MTFIIRIIKVAGSALAALIASPPFRLSFGWTFNSSGREFYFAKGAPA